MNTLLPCPCCGHQPVESELDDAVYPLNRTQTLWTACCVDSQGGCNLGSLARTREEAIARWNRRTPQPVPTA
jgi:hypothetical protein